MIKDYLIHVQLFFKSKKFHCLDDLAAAFKKHLEVYGGLDICINNAGIATPLLFHKDTTDGSGTWKRTINVNLTAVVDCTRIAVCLTSLL